MGGCRGGGSGGGGSGKGGGRVGGGVRMDVNEELKVFVKIQKKKKLWGGRVGGVRWGGGSGWWGEWARVDVNTMLGVGGDVVYGGCEPRVEGIVQGT